METLLEQLLNNLDEIYDDAMEIEFLNHSNSDDEYLTVYDMKSPDLARNNCAPVSWQVIEDMTLNLYATFDSVETICIDEPWIRHYAVCFTRGSEEIVLDFTARQFNCNAPLLMALPRAEWEQWLLSRTLVTTILDNISE